MNRRRALTQSFRFSAAMLVSGAFLRADQSTAARATADVRHFLMIGDWGWAEDAIGPQAAVAQGMARYSEKSGFSPEALFLLGDNFYGPLHGGTACPRWKLQFEEMYPEKAFPGPCYAVLGNHDYDDEPGKLNTELAYGPAHPGTRWHLPAKWYRFDLGPAASPLAHVFALDTNHHNGALSLTPQEKAEQLAWFTREIERPRTAPWLIVIGHHPLYTDGIHGDDPELIAAWDELFRKHHVHFYFCGHDHDLQHLEFRHHPTSFVISGAGGAAIREPNHQRGPFAKGVYGFTHLEITAERLIVRHLDASGTPLHAFAKKTDGSWSLV
jgi:tartrate-resistant acid phosphatase type 5